MDFCCCRSWHNLNDALRAAVEETCTAGIARNLGRAEAIQGPVLESLEQKGAETRLLPEPVLAALRAESAELLNERAAKDPTFARVLQSQRRFSESYARWKRLAYPRDIEEYPVDPLVLEDIREP